MLVGNGDDVLCSEDATSTVDMNGGLGSDTCTSGDSTSDCDA